MPNVIGPYIENIDDLTIIDVASYPPKQPAGKLYRIKAVFRDAKDRTFRRVTLFIDKMEAEGKLSQDAANTAHYYLNRLTLPKFLRKRYAARLNEDGAIEITQPDGKPMPGHDIKLMAFNF